MKSQEAGEKLQENLKIFAKIVNISEMAQIG